MTSLWNLLTGRREETWMSRPWDLTEIVPLRERRWFQVCAGIIVLFVGVILLAVVHP